MRRTDLAAIIFAWAFIILFVSGCAGKDKPRLGAESYYNSGYAYHEKGQNEKAITNYTNIHLVLIPLNKIKKSNNLFRIFFESKYTC